MSQSMHALLMFVVMVVVFFAAHRFGKMPTALCLLCAAVVGAIVSGEGIALRHIVEGSFTFFDIVAIIITASLFIAVQRESGGLNIIVRDLIRGFCWSTPLLLIVLMFVVMLPGAITGSGTAAVMAVGGLVGGVLARLGIPQASVAAFVAIGGVLGLAAPPINIPAMILASGINMPYVGFFGPLLILTVSLGVICALIMGVRHVERRLDPGSLLEGIPIKPIRLGRLGAYLPLLVVIGLLVLQRIFPQSMPNLGIPLVFMIGAFVALGVAKGVSFVSVSRQSLTETMEVSATLIAVGSLVQVMALTGVRGMFVITAITAPYAALLTALAIGLPLSGSVLGALGAASVFGVPFMLALLGRDPILVGSGIGLICALASVVPPTAIVGNAAVVVTKFDGKYSEIVKRFAIPWVLITIAGLLTVIYADQLKWMRW